MVQKLSYRLEFTFSSEREDRDRLLSHIDLFIRVLEDTDRLLAHSFGLELEYRRSLKDMGENVFRYAITANLHVPRQFLLGSWPDKPTLRHWMQASRRTMVDAARKGEAHIEELLRQWHQSAAEAGLTQSLMYVRPSRERVGVLLNDLVRASRILGEVVLLD